jgi:hypothetical protein
MSKVKAYTIEDVEFMAKLQFNGKVLIERSFDLNDPNVHFYTPWEIDYFYTVTVDKQDRIAHATNWSTNLEIMKLRAVVEINGFLSKLTPEGLERANKEIARIKAMV